jgi:2-polyprenyl-6-methoxyphenol hydroxylase-like FAD-dependent oxidoreductase
VLEAWDRLDERLRATQYGVPATKVFRRAGILDDIRAVSIDSFPGICWRRVSDHRRLTGIDLSAVKGHPDRMTILPLNQILRILYKHCLEKGKGLIEVKFGHRVVGVGQDEGKAWVDVAVEKEGKARFEADFVVGCDGGSSTVRRALFGRSWPGQTFDCRLLVQNVGFFFSIQRFIGFLTRARSGMMDLKNMDGMEEIIWYVFSDIFHQVLNYLETC